MPRWTIEQLREYELRNKARDIPSDSKPQQIVRHESLAKDKGKEGHPKRCKIVIVSYRKRLIDPDNLCGKFHIDALRYCGVIEDDTAKHVVIEMSQEKVKRDERTEIEIIPQ